MTVVDLIRQLEQLEPDRLVIVASDEEGNDFATLSDVESGAYDPETGECGLETLNDRQREAGFDESDRSLPADS